MRTAGTSNDIEITRSPTAVYDFVTTPANWVGTHPVTAEVKGDTDHSAGVGDRWVELIQPPGEPVGHETEWMATTAVPGHTWVIETSRLTFAGVRCQIVYTFVGHDGGTYFRRDMSVMVDDNAEVDDEFLRNVSDDTSQAGYLHKVKELLEN